jgi:membrane-associated protease RseP (regulator of RpoE activity)
MNSSRNTYLIHSGLFLLTLITTTLSGAEWMYGGIFLPIPGAKLLGWAEFWQGLNFSLPFLLVLTVHEFGHYFTAKANNVRVTLPFYIPLWLGGLGQGIGTMGAFIRIKDVIRSRTQFFDIGIAGPLAGFVVALGLLWYGFTHLPPADYIFSIHPEYRKWGLHYGEFAYRHRAEGASTIAFGDNLLFWFFKTYVADPARLPHPFEMMHYPYLLAGYLSLFFTALNLLPIGQLDGGHVLYGLIGKRWFGRIAPVLYVAFLFYAGLGIYHPEEFAIANDEAFIQKLFGLLLYIGFLYICLFRLTENRLTTVTLALSIAVGQLLLVWAKPDWEGYAGFLAFAFILGRFLGVTHPDTDDGDEPLTTGRQVLGWLTLLVFILCASPKPFMGG